MVVWANEKKGIMKWVYRILTLGLSDISPRTVSMGQKTGIFYYCSRYSLGIYSAWLCRIHFWINKSKSMVVNSSYAYNFPVFSNGIWNCNGYVYLYGDFIFQEPRPLI